MPRCARHSDLASLGRSSDQQSGSDHQDGSDRSRCRVNQVRNPQALAKVFDPKNAACANTRAYTRPTSEHPAQQSGSPEHMFSRVGQGSRWEPEVPPHFAAHLSHQRTGACFHHTVTPWVHHFICIHKHLYTPHRHTCITYVYIYI